MDKYDTALVHADPMVSKALSRLLLDMGRTVKAFSTAEEAVEATADLLVVDISAREMGGIALAELCRERMPAVFVTAGSSDDERRAALKLGPVVSKPVSKDALSQAVTAAQKKRNTDL